mgnify:CR=1 FL=1
MSLDRIAKQVDKLAEEAAKSIIPKKKGIQKGERIIRLNDEEKKFIREKVVDPEWTDARIAKELGRYPDTVSRYRKSVLKLRKGSGGQLANLVTNTTVEKIVEKLDDDQSKVNLIRKFFVESSRGKNLREKLGLDDFVFFADQWALYHVQFDDMKTSEEDLLESMILLQIRMRKNQANVKQCEDILNTYKKELGDASTLNPENQKDLQILETIATYNGKEIELNKEYTIMTDKLRELMGTFSATREQRENKEKVGGKTFFDKIKELNNRESRERLGRINELMKKARDKKKNDLMQPHQYMDGQYDIPILSGMEIKKNEESTNNGD